ncbi:anti-phage protein KwaA [Tenacibaculum singaporense]|uniref:anti-phage protein KwaA n=1 Tax=Tenacibaculum singaporense TaxID=2358479 RepID=UPI000F6772F0|nr:anti-phage protein KwaA [Tenacibaculum singaporense]RSC92590.1 hypothetical protein EI424_14190 [Tenacibaculum singaporense]
MYRKIGLFFLSLWLFFLLTIIITIDFPICFYGSCKFIGVIELFKSNIIPIICIVCLLIGAYSYLDFSYKLRDATQIPFKIVKIENIDYEHLTFLTTYIVPLVCFNFIDVRYQIVLLILLIVIGVIYIRTDLFYANPTLALLNYRIYKIDGEFKEGIRNNIILITRSELEVNKRCDYIKLDNRIYYAKPKSV